MTRPETFTKVEPVSGAEQVAALSCADALHQRENPLVLFSAALLFTHGGFDRDPVAEFDARFPAESADLRPFYVDLARDGEYFFSGFGSMPAPGRQRVVNWDKRVYCIDQRRKDECFEFLGGIAYSNPKAKLFANSFLHPVSVPDPTSKIGQFLDITVVGVMSNSFVVYLEPQWNAPAIVRKVSTTQPGLIPHSIHAAGILGGFTGKDPLDMRDE
jgi:hypothetical protein